MLSLIYEEKKYIHIVLFFKCLKLEKEIKIN